MQTLPSGGSGGTGSHAEKQIDPCGRYDAWHVYRIWNNLTAAGHLVLHHSLTFFTTSRRCAFTSPGLLLRVFGSIFNI
jgi:hypothetical protein